MAIKIEQLKQYNCNIIQHMYTEQFITKINTSKE